MRMMALLAGLLALGSVPAIAQDYPDAFGGLYLGAHGGLRIDHGSISGGGYTGDTTAFDSSPLDDSTSTGSPSVGFQLGYSHYATPDIVIGIETDVDDVDSYFDAESTCTGCGPDTTNHGSVHIGWQGSTRLRAGFVHGNELWYGTAGISYAQLQWDDTLEDGSAVASSQDQTQLGYAVGLGVDWIVVESLTFRLEYLHEGYGSLSVPLADSSENGSVSLDTDKLRFGINLRVH